MAVGWELLGPCQPDSSCTLQTNQGLTAISQPLAWTIISMPMKGGKSKLAAQCDCVTWCVKGGGIVQENLGLPLNAPCFAFQEPKAEKSYFTLEKESSFCKPLGFQQSPHCSNSAKNWFNFFINPTLHGKGLWMVIHRIDLGFYHYHTFW